MKLLIVFLALQAAAWPQCGKLVVNPLTGLLDCVSTGGSAGPAGPAGPTGPTGPAGPGFIDFEVTVAGTVLTVKAGNAAIGTPVTTFVLSTATITAVSGTGVGTAKVYISTGGAIVVEHSSAAGLTVTNANLTSSAVPSPAVPLGAKHLADVVITGGVWASATDKRAATFLKPIIGTTGIIVTEVSGVTQVAIDTADVPRLGSANAWTNYNDFSGGTISLPVAFTTLTDGATITWSVASAPLANATVTLGGSRTLNVTNLVNGGSYVLRIVQDGTGSRGLTLGTGCTWKVSGGGTGAITPTTTASAIDVLAFTYDGTNCYGNFAKNFN